MLWESKVNTSPSLSVTHCLSQLVIILSWSATMKKSTHQRPQSNWFQLAHILSPGNSLEMFPSLIHSQAQHLGENPTYSRSLYRQASLTYHHLTHLLVASRHHLYPARVWIFRHFQKMLHPTCAKPPLWLQRKPPGQLWLIASKPLHWTRGDEFFFKEHCWEQVKPSSAVTALRVGCVGMTLEEQ